MKNNLQNKSLVLALSLIGVVSCMSASAMNTIENQQIHEVEVFADTSDEVKISVNIDGEMTELTLPKAVLEDKAQLAAALEHLPEDLRANLIDDLSSFHHDGKMIKKLKKNHESDVSWHSDADKEHVIVIKNNEAGAANKHTKKIIKEFKHISEEGDEELVFEINHQGMLNADSIIRLLKNGKFSAEELNQIQQALDAKR